MRQPIRHMLGMTSVLVLSACSSTGVSVTGEDSIFRNKELDYTKAPLIERLNVPSDLQNKRLQKDLLVVPDADTSLSQAGITEAPRPAFVFAEMGSQSAQLLGANQGKHIAVNGTPEMIWQQVGQFWQLQNMPLAVADSASGIMETEWVPLPGVDGDPGIVGGWLRSLTGGDDDLAYSRVRTEMVLNDAGLIEISLGYVQASHGEVASGKRPDWQQEGHEVEAKSELMFALLQYLSRTVRVAHKSTQDMSHQHGLLGKDQKGRPLIRIDQNQVQAMRLLLQAMADMDVGSHDAELGKIYFTHTTHLQAVSEKEQGGGVWGWFKGLHSGSKNQQESRPVTLDMSVLGGKKAVEEAAPVIVYSANNVMPSVSDDPKDRKGYKIWMGGEVIYIFEDEDQGEVDADGVYTFTGYFQLQLTPTIKGVYVQVLSSMGTHAGKAHAEEILWLIKQGL
ncbi:MAG: outer membrane protein assembly factor BamC [Gammaproteobacteria bacterium]|nr:outer membrane protein assembly factor BamC [Gammaproteobacteria bacterium]